MTKTDAYQPALQVLRHLVAFPQDEEQADKFWRLTDKIMRCIADAQHTLTGREGLRFVAPEDGDSDSADEEAEKQAIVAELLQVSSTYEARIADLEATVKRLRLRLGREHGADTRQLALADGFAASGGAAGDGAALVTRRQFEAMEARYREGLRRIRVKISELDSEISQLRDRLRRVLANSALTPAAASDMRRRHRQRQDALVRIMADGDTDADVLLLESNDGSDGGGDDAFGDVRIEPVAQRLRSGAPMPGNEAADELRMLDAFIAAPSALGGVTAAGGRDSLGDDELSSLGGGVGAWFGSALADVPLYDLAPSAAAAGERRREHSERRERSERRDGRSERRRQQQQYHRQGDEQRDEQGERRHGHRRHSQRRHDHDRR